MERKAPSSKADKSRQSEAAPALSAKAAGVARRLTVRPDGLDFRDKMYVPTLVEVPTAIELADYMARKIPILDQGQEGACTGFGLATVAHYLLRSRGYRPDLTDISPLMLYDMARRYDEWSGEDYEGSSCRGAMKGWFKHGVCSATLWMRGGKVPRVLSEPVEADAANRPLGAYFRVNHKDIIAMHAAISEVGVLYASATVHAGWEKVKKDGRIALNSKILGGHAFAIVAYDREGFWIQNSWGDDWGYKGFCHIGYDDWLANGTDTWVARLGAPIELPKAAGVGKSRAVLAASTANFALSDIRPHIVSIGNDGLLNPRGDIGTTPETVREILENDFPRITQGWKKKRLVLYAHGGLVGQADALQLVSDYRKPMLDAECYPLAFIWKTDYWTTLANMLADAAKRRRPEGFLDNTKDFMLDRLDDALEPIARVLTGKAEWDEMKENALLATVAKDGGARLVADALAKLAKDQDFELHVVGHSAGSIFHGPLLQYLTASGAIINDGPLAGAKVKGLGLPVATCTLWAPACTVQLFKETYLPAVQGGRIGRLSLFTLTDKAEQDDNCARIYNKSLLYLVSHAFEAKPRIPLIRPDGEPILGMAKCIEQDAELSKLFAGGKADWVTAPNNQPLGSTTASTARHHGDFDNDEATVHATLARILGSKAAAVPAGLSFSSGAGAKAVRRGYIAKATN